MVPFLQVLAMVTAVQSEPLDQRMAPRAIALEIARVSDSLEDAAAHVVIAWEEGRLIPNAIGDHGKALCVDQLQHAPAVVLRDLRACIELGAKRLRASMAACPAHPFAPYASGSCALSHRLSAVRQALSDRLLAAAR